MLPEIRGLKRSFEIIDSSSSVFLGGNCRTAVKKEKGNLCPYSVPGVSCTILPRQLYEVCVMSTILQTEEGGTLTVSKLAQSCRVNQWLDRLETGLAAPVTHFPGETGNVLPRAHVWYTLHVRPELVVLWELGN